MNDLFVKYQNYVLLFFLLTFLFAFFSHYPLELVMTILSLLSHFPPPLTPAPPLPLPPLSNHFVLCNHRRPQ